MQAGMFRAPPSAGSTVSGILGAASPAPPSLAKDGRITGCQYRASPRFPPYSRGYIQVPRELT